MNRRIVVLITGDILAALIAQAASFYVRLGESPSRVFDGEGALRALLFVVVMLFSTFFVELYNREKDAGGKEIAVRIAVEMCVSFALLSMVFYVIPSIKYGRGVFVLSLTVFGIIHLMWHLWFKAMLNLTGFAKRVLILGTGPLARQMGDIIVATNHDYILSGYVNCASEPLHVPLHTVVGNGEGLFETVIREKAQKIVVSLSERRGIFPVQDVLNCKLNGIEVMDAPTFYERVTGKLLIENITPSWVIFSEGFRVTFILRLFKRFFDIFSSLLGLLMVAPFLPLVALAIKLDSPGPVLFRQIRVGEGEKLFSIYKFRTMGQDAESSTGAVWAQEKDPRVTRLGAFLRKSRIDEIPQLFNVLKGEMSFVGPRPERPEFVQKLKEIIPYYSERHCVKPGVTGWAQVKYPYGASVEDAVEKLRYDLYYIKNLTHIFDLVIILETVKVVLFRRGSR